jgi:hypothetical protein
VCGAEMKKVYSKPEFLELSNVQVIWLFDANEPLKTLAKAAERFADERS